MRKFGVDRLISASDYPDNRLLKPEEIYDSYFDILNQIDFTQAEAEMIACDITIALIKDGHSFEDRVGR